MINSPNNKAPWFRAKRYGYGSGLPITWQGWVLTVAHLAAIMVVVYAFKNQLPLMVPLLFIATFAPLPFYAARTEGGWKWRNGGQID